MRLYKFIFIYSVFIIGLVSCKKKSDLVLSSDQLGIGSYLKLDSTINRNINFADLNNTSVAINVSGYGEPVDSVIIYVSPTNSIDKTTWRRIKGYKTVDNKAQLVVRATELAAALGIPPSSLVPGKQYTLFNEVVTAGGKRYSVVNTVSDFESAVDYKMAMRWIATVICPFVPSQTAGTYIITVDRWDGAVGEQAVVTTTSNTVTITYLYPYASPDPGFRPVTINVDPATGVATMPKQTYGGYGPGFQNFTGQGSGYVFSCTGTITLNVTHVSAGGTSYGTYPITLVK